MEDYKTIKRLSNLSEFERVIKKVTIWSESNRGIIFKENEFIFLLSAAIILLRNYDKDKRYQSYAEFAYYIILKYALISRDYEPLYDFSVNFGFYPIAKSLVSNEKIIIKSILDNNTQERIQEEYEYRGLIETYDQKKIRESILEDESDEICFVAPTSYGKSSLIIESINENRENHKTVSIIVPTKSLLTQTFKSLRTGIKKQKIILHDEMYENEDSFVSVLTQERALRLLTKNPDLSFDILYIDEAHNLFSRNNRTILLSRLIRLNKKRNINQKVVYLSPLISNSDNLKFDINQDIVEQKIDFNMKEPEIYELCLDSTIQKYNRFIDKFYKIGNECNYLNYIRATSMKKNFFFLTSPKKIELFSKDIYNHFDNIQSEELESTMKILRKYIHEDFYGIRYLKKGIIYLHGQLPDYIKEYLEFKFKVIDEVKYLIANSVVLEGINLPIDSLYILSVHGLSSEELTNLIGRVNRLNMIFTTTNSNYNLLLPNVHFVNNTKYARKDSNMSRKIRKLRTGRFHDFIENPLLLEFDIDMYSKKEDEKKREEAEKIIEEENFILSESEKSDIEILKKKMLEIGMNTIYTINDSLCNLLFAKLTKEDNMVTENIVSEIQNIFVKGVQNYIIDREFIRLEHDKTVNYYENFISISKKKSLKDNIENVLLHFTKEKKNNRNFMYMGKSFGEVPYGGTSSKGNPVYVDLRTKSRAELANLAIIKLKMESDFINYTLIKFFQLLLDYNKISINYYNTLTNGTNDKTKLALLKQGLTIQVINKLDKDNQLRNIYIDKDNIAHGNMEFENYKNSLDDFFSFEINKFL